MEPFFIAFMGVLAAASALLGWRTTRHKRRLGRAMLKVGAKDTRVSFALERLGLTQVLHDPHDKDKVVGACGEIDGVTVEVLGGVATGGEGESYLYTAAISLAPLAPAVTLMPERVRRAPGELVLGDAMFDTRFVIRGSLSAAVLHLDVAARVAARFEVPVPGSVPAFHVVYAVSPAAEPTPSSPRKHAGGDGCCAAGRTACSASTCTGQTRNGSWGAYSLGRFREPRVALAAIDVHDWL